MHLATKILASVDALRASAWAENDDFLRRGSRDLVDAALAENVAHSIYPSVVFVYRDGGTDWLEAPTALDSQSGADPGF